MVLLEANKLIIEIETTDPTGDLEVYQTALIDVLDHFDYEEHAKHLVLPIFSLLKQTFSASTTGKKLIIEIETGEPKEMLIDWQNGLNNALSFHDFELCSSIVKPLFELLRQTIKIVSKVKK